MAVRPITIDFKHVLKANFKSNVDEWYQGARNFRNYIIKNNMYQTAPLYYTIENLNEETREAEYCFYIPVNSKPEVINEEGIAYIGHISTKGIFLVHDDLDEDITEVYDELRNVARELNLTLKEPFYNVYLDIYGEGAVQVVAPIKENENES